MVGSQIIAVIIPYHFTVETDHYPKAKYGKPFYIQIWKSIRFLITCGDDLFVPRAKRFTACLQKSDLNVSPRTWTFHGTTIGWKLSWCWLPRLWKKKQTGSKCSGTEIWTEFLHKFNYTYRNCLCLHLHVSERSPSQVKDFISGNCDLLYITLKMSSRRCFNWTLDLFPEYQFPQYSHVYILHLYYRNLFSKVKRQIEEHFVFYP